MKKLIWILAFCFLWACQDVERPEKPKDLISQEVMSDILAEAYLANAARSINNRIIRKYGFKLDSIIYKKYDIDSVRFAKSHAYYTSELNIYNDLFLTVEAKLLKMQQANDIINKMLKKIRDSLAKRRRDSLDALKKDTLDLKNDSLETAINPMLIDPEEVEMDQDSIE